MIGAVENENDVSRGSDNFDIAVPVAISLPVGNYKREREIRKPVGI